MQTNNMNRMNTYFWDFFKFLVLLDLFDTSFLTSSLVKSLLVLMESSNFDPFFSFELEFEESMTSCFG